MGNFPDAQCLGLHIITADGLGLIPGLETKILQALWHSQINLNEKTLHAYIFLIVVFRVDLSNMY